jgi:hypothetical protein
MEFLPTKLKSHCTLVLLLAVGLSMTKLPMVMTEIEEDPEYVVPLAIVTDPPPLQLSCAYVLK